MQIRELRDRCDANARFELLCDKSLAVFRCRALLHFPKCYKIYLPIPIRNLLFLVLSGIASSLFSIGFNSCDAQIETRWSRLTELIFPIRFSFDIVLNSPTSINTKTSMLRSYSLRHLRSPDFQNKLVFAFVSDFSVSPRTQDFASTRLNSSHPNVNNK